jgi:hypothetical protein
MIVNWLNRPYPFVAETNIKWALSMMVGLICFLFLAAFRPFGLDQVDNVTYIAGFGLTAFLSLFLHFFILPSVLPQYFEVNRWSIWKQLVFVSSMILIISVLNFIYNSTIGLDISPQYNLGYFIIMTSLTGILPIVSMTYVIERIENKRNISAAKSFKLPSYLGSERILITIESENQTEQAIVFELENFLYASSSNNYLDLFYLENGNPKTELVRLSLKGLLSQVEKYPQIKRVHKSYVINVKNIEAVEGNARSLYVQLKNTDRQIPISRSIARETLN